ncbi:DUF4245 domain-containing protein [Sciscionella marina]|uniref:DUF4245 domain-containing protein n=1 Tax=Sciscionella marina TaxID=508770 RepID=UPI00036B45B3|nr:DUF4245 domain-containing protein [Sciscionella marina]
MTEQNPGAQNPQAQDRRTQRLRLGTRDMMLTMVVLAVVVLVLVGLLGGWSFSPGHASVDESVQPRQDAHKQLTTVAQDMHFPIRVPELPGDWWSNSGDVSPLGGLTEVRTGWVTPQNGYLRLVQSDAPTGPLVAEAAEAKDSTPSATGTQQAGGVPWRTYPAVRNEQTWIRDTGAVRILITGNASEAQFRTLATAMATAQPVPRPAK